MGTSYVVVCLHYTFAHLVFAIHFLYSVKADLESKEMMVSMLCFFIVLLIGVTV